MVGQRARGKSAALEHPTILSWSSYTMIIPTISHSGSPLIKLKFEFKNCVLNFFSGCLPVETRYYFSTVVNRHKNITVYQYAII